MSLHQNRFARALLVVGLLTGPSAAHAASDGDLGATSQGSVDLSLTVPQLVRISDLADIDLGTFAGDALTGSDSVCVWSTTRAYAITASGDGAGGAFSLTGSTNGDTLPYAVQWAESAGASSGTGLSSGAALTGRTTSAVSPTCGGGANLNATVIVNVTDTQIAGVSSDTYSGTLTLTVEPE